MGPADRRQKLLRALCLRRHDTYDHLAREFHVSERTIRYGITDLMRSYPIETVQGRGGGVKVGDGFYLYQTKRLSAKQCAVLKKLSAQSDADDRATLDSILAKFAP